MRPARSISRRTLAGAILLATALGLSGCFTISERAIRNGAAMNPQAPLQWRSTRDMSQLRSQYYEIAPLRSLYQMKPYQPFTHWQ